MTAHYDLAIVGTGSGNSLVTPDFDDKRVAIIESGIFGGTCINVGCIPTKMFVYAADVAETVRDTERYGIDATLDKVHWPAIRDRIFGRIDPISESGRHYRAEGPNTSAYFGRARFTGERELTVALDDGGEATLTADQIVLATGAHPVIPEVITDSGVPFHTSDTVMRIDAVPERLVILGAGFIAMEMAHIFSGLGSRVTILARGPQLVRHLDADVSTRFTRLARSRWDVRTDVTVEAASASDGQIELRLSDGTTADGDLLLIATGRAPSTADLDLGTVGIEVHDDGRIVVDEHGRTTAAGVWSLGDASSPHQLKHVANAEARVVAHNLVHPDDLRSFDHEHVPSAIFSHPQIATVGLTEEECREEGRRYVSKVQAYGDTAYGWAMEDTTSICKVIADPASGLLLGAHIMGPQASSLIQPLIQGMAFGTRVDDVASRQYWIHPALAEVIENALLGLDLD